MEDTSKNKKKSHLVVLCIGSGVATIRYPLHVPPSLREIRAAEKCAQESLNLPESPVAVNWLPLSD